MAMIGHPPSPAAARHHPPDPFDPVSGPAPHLVLVGLMGAGKSTVGRLLASRVGRPFVDVDVEIVERTGHDVEALWRTGGEAAYRSLERDVVVEVLRRAEPQILAAPAGIVDDPDGVAALRRPRVAVVYLRTSEPDLLADRIARQHQPRPLLGDRPVEVLREQLARRDSRYGALADLVLSVEGVAPADLADAVAAAGLLGAAS
jgi:shikimate kinase